METSQSDCCATSESQNSTAPIGTPVTAPWYETYRPLLTVFGVVLLVSAADQVRLGGLDGMLFMSHLMAGFFIGLSLFKLLDRSAFAATFAGYDPIARAWPTYGRYYPFLELGLGLLFVTGRAPITANAGTIVFLAPTTYGVWKRLKDPSPFQCACLGTSFSLPLSRVTIGENLAMIAMALYGLVTI